MSVNCVKSRKYHIYIKRSYKNVVFHAVSSQNMTISGTSPN